MKKLKLGWKKKRAKKYRSHVYVIQSERGGPVKIGVADDPQVRLRQLNTGSDEKLRILKLFGFKSRRDTFEFETYLHRKFKHLNVRLEWFSLGPDLLIWLWCHLVFPRFRPSDIISILWHL